LLGAAKSELADGVAPEKDRKRAYEHEDQARSPEHGRGAGNGLLTSGGRRDRDLTDTRSMHAQVDYRSGETHDRVEYRFEADTARAQQHRDDLRPDHANDHDDGGGAADDGRRFQRFKMACALSLHGWN